MNVFDFDNTLYHGESAVDFAFFMIHKNQKIILWIPTILWNLLKYKLCLVTREEMERIINKFLKVLIQDEENLRCQVRLFWENHDKKLDQEMLKLVSAEDVILTAGPDFLLNEISNQLGTSHIQSSKVDLRKKNIIYLNFRSNKVKRFYENYGNAVIEKFYTDSYNDKALMEISESVFLVKKGKTKIVK